MRTLRSPDIGTILGSVQKTGHLVVVEEGPVTGGWAGEIIASVYSAGGEPEWAFRIAGPDLPLPFARPLEAGALSDAAQIESAVVSRFNEDRP